MTLDDAKAHLEALPGVYEATMLVVRDNPDMPRHVRLHIRCGGQGFLPKETVLHILEIHDMLGGGAGWHVAFTVSAGLRMPGASG